MPALSSVASPWDSRPGNRCQEGGQIRQIPQGRVHEHVRDHDSGNHSEYDQKFTYLVKESLGVMGPRNRRKLDKPDLVTEATFVVVHALAVNDCKRFAGLTNINRAKIATLQSVAMTVSQL